MFFNKAMTILISSFLKNCTLWHGPGFDRAPHTCTFSTNSWQGI